MTDDNKMGEGDVAVLGQDVVLREKESLTDLLNQLPRKVRLYSCLVTLKKM